MSSGGGGRLTRMTQLTTEQLNRAVTNGLTSTFITARAAVRAMVPQGSGGALTGTIVNTTCGMVPG